MNEKTLIKILHLEDSVRDAQLVADMLANDSVECDITHARDAVEFDAALLRTRFDLVLCDYNVPGYDGIAALIHARKQQPETPVIIVSGSMDEEDAVKCLQIGATDYLLKDRLERFVPAVKRALLEAEEHRKRRQSEKELRESEERFRQLAQHSSEVFWFSSADPERVLFVSPAVERIWGLPPNKFYEDAQLVWKAVHPEERSRVHASWRACVSGIKPRFEEEYRIVHPDGAIRWVLDSRTIIRDEIGKITRISGVARDVTERRHAEQQALRAQRLESLGTLAGGVAHDLNNALAPILIATELLRLEFDDRAGKYLKVIEAAAARGADMVRQLLTFAKGSDGQRLPLQPRKLIAEMEKLISSTFPKNITFEVYSPKKLNTVSGDPTQLHQVLLNLCVNARDAMPDGGTLTIRAENVEVDAVYAEAVHEAKLGRYVVWRIQDTGTGIPAEVLERIFEPFFTTKGPEKGTGLGLSTVIGIVKSHNGFLRVYSVPGKGSTFAVYLPTATAAQHDTTIIERDELKLRGNGETILVVDDEIALRDIVRDVLTALNFKVLCAADGLEAMEQLRDHHDDIQVVITDLHMPNMDGLAFVRLLKNTVPFAGVVVISGRMEEQEQQEFAKLGIDAVLEKPFTQARLFAALKRILARSCGAIGHAALLG